MAYQVRASVVFQKLTEDGKVETMGEAVNANYNLSYEQATQVQQAVVKAVVDTYFALGAANLEVKQENP